VPLDLCASKLTVVPRKPGLAEPMATELRNAEPPERLEHVEAAIEHDLARTLARALVQQFLADTHSVETSNEGTASPK
jgi:hypothetical protein